MGSYQGGPVVDMSRGGGGGGYQYGPRPDDRYSAQPGYPYEREGPAGYCYPPRDGDRRGSDGARVGGIGYQYGPRPDDRRDPDFYPGRYDPNPRRHSDPGSDRGQYGGHGGRY